MKLTLQTKSNQIKNKAINLGFHACGIAQADFLHNEEPHLKNWLDKKYHGEMGYMANNVEKRLDPRKLVKQAQSVVVVLLNYFPASKQHDLGAPVISKYAYGKDYHTVIKSRLKKLFQYINQEIAPVQGGVFVDSAPVLEHAWAKQAGLGWIGKNSLLLTRKHGSFVFIGELILNIQLAPDEPFQNDFCGSCNRCITACPTGAIVEPYVVDANRCISYLTIELKGETPDNLTSKLQNRVFGCDICQDVCPWNRELQPNNIPELQPAPELLELTREEWKQMDHEDYLRIFQNSAVKRAKFKKLKCNIEFLFENKSAD